MLLGRPTARVHLAEALLLSNPRPSHHRHQTHNTGFVVQDRLTTPNKTLPSRVFGTAEVSIRTLILSIKTTLAMHQCSLLNKYNDDTGIQFC